MSFKFLKLLVFLIAAPLTLEAKIFKNAYISFQLPDRWECVLEDTEWVCRSRALDQAREAIIILTAKEVGPSDTLNDYLEFLKRPRTITLPSQQKSLSRVYKVNEANINGQKWVDGLHLGSEIPNYFTRYLATIKDRIAILVTFSSHTQHYTKYSKDFLEAVNSLRVVAERSALQQGHGSGGSSMGSGTIGQDSMIDIGDVPPEDQANSNSKSKGSSSSSLLLVGVVLIALAAFAYFKMKKK